MLAPEVRAVMMPILIISAVFALVNYIITGYAIFSVSKAEKIDKPWLGWVPIGNFYQLIKLGKGNYFFIFALIGVMVFSAPINMFSSILGIVCSIIYSLYSIKMYYSICDRYDVSFIFIAIGALSPICILIKSLGTFIIPVFLIGMYGQIRLALNAKKPRETKARVIETSVVSSKKKKKKK